MTDQTSLDFSVSKPEDQYYCQTCNYTTHRKYNFLMHIDSLKHKSFNPEEETSTDDILKKTCPFCNQQFNCKSSMYRHKKRQHKIIQSGENSISNPTISPEFIIEIIKQNTEFKELLIQQNEQIVIQNEKLVEMTSKITCVNTTNNNNSHSHNKTFNMQVFLNETCKDAMNMKDFIDSIQLQLSDFENIGSQGYINGISNIIIKNLKALDENMRPVHCSDVKRESIYVKDQNKWEKDTEDNKKIKSLIKQIAQKNVKMIPKYREEYPDSQYGYSKRSDIYSRAIIEAMGGPGDDDEAKANKIVKRIAREILIDKQQQQQQQPQQLQQQQQQPIHSLLLV